VPRKCNTSIYINKKIHYWLQEGQGQEIGGYDSMREGDKGAKYFYYILFTHIGFNWEKWLHELLGRKAMWFLFSCNYINIPCGLFWGFTCSSPFTLTPLSLFHFWCLILAN
jgi:hypothetical protein